LKAQTESGAPGFRLRSAGFFTSTAVSGQNYSCFEKFTFSSFFKTIFLPLFGCHHPMPEVG
jgi:hypothetical protein